MDTTVEIPDVAPEIPDVAPVMPEMPADGVPTLGDAVIGGMESALTPDAVAAPPMTPDQIIGLVAELSSLTVPGAVKGAYKADYISNELVRWGVDASGLAEALAEYGISAGGGKMPPWLSVILGTMALGYGIYATRSKYVITIDTEQFEQTENDAGTGVNGGAGGGVDYQTAQPVQPVTATYGHSQYDQASASGGQIDSPF